jgi:uncharacterized protein (TIGR02246 family)
VDFGRSPTEITARFQEAWNTHDMEVFRALFHADATFVNRFGTYWRGVDEIVAGHVSIHASIYRDSTLVIDVLDVDPISDTAAILHFWTRLSAGAAHPAGPHLVDTLILAVVTEHDGEWRIQALENVTLSNPKTGAALRRP